MNTAQKVILVMAALLTFLLFISVPPVEYIYKLPGSAINHYRLDTPATIYNDLKYFIPTWLAAGILYLVCKSPERKN